MRSQLDKIERSKHRSGMIIRKKRDLNKNLSNLEKEVSDIKKILRNLK